MIPSSRMALSKYPSSRVVSQANGGFANFMPPSKSSNRNGVAWLCQLMFGCFCSLGLWPGAIELNGGADEILQRSLIDDIVFVEVNSAARLGFKASVEDAMRIVQKCTL